MDALAENGAWMARKISSVYGGGDVPSAVTLNRNESLAYFLSGIRHQLSACKFIAAATLKELVEAMSNNSAPEVIDELIESIRSIRKNINRLRALQAGEDWDSRFPVQDAVEVVASTRKLMLPLATRSKIGLRVTVEAKGVVDIDRFHLEQIIMNLYRNAEQAILASSDKSGEVRFIVHKPTEFDQQLCSLVSEKSYLCVTVKNSGPGIDPDTFARIGDLKFTTKPKGEGSGHGLQVCAYLMEKNGGFMLAKTHPVEGTEFTLFFPEARLPKMRR